MSVTSAHPLLVPNGIPDNWTAAVDADRAACRTSRAPADSPIRSSGGSPTRSTRTRS